MSSLTKFCWLAVVGCCLLPWTLVAFDEPHNDKNTAPRKVDFDTEVVPVLTKAGCNAAACHGAAAGRGGFYLSLFGSKPEFDFRQIARDLNGRRVNEETPELSLLLRKPAGELEHEGGVRFEVDSREYQLLRDWIGDGAVRQHPRRAESMKVTFAQDSTQNGFSANELPVTLRPRVDVYFSDGEVRDVTAWSRFEVDDPELLKVDHQNKIEVLRSGRAHLFVTFLDQIEVIPITTARSNSEPIEETFQAINSIDERINADLRQLGLPAQPRADDATLVRRATLALTGELPSVATVERYLQDKAPNKYEQYVDELLQSPSFNRYWAYRFGRYLRVSAPPKEPEVAVAIHSWLQEGFREERSWGDMMSEMIAASGDTHRSGPAAIHRLSSDPRSEAEYMSEVVLGIRLRCANCHDHPLDRWTQDDYHGLAAIFAQVSRGRTIDDRPTGSVIHPGTGEEAVRRLPGDRPLAEDTLGRNAFAGWIRSEPQHLLARVTVNRLWQSMMGRGLVEPVDDLRDSNPPTHPELFDDLTHEFIANDYRVRPILRSIAMSEAFRRQTGFDDALSTRFHAAFRANDLDPALLLDAISQVTKIVEEELTLTDSERARDQANPYFESTALDALGRCQLGDACTEGSTENSLTLPTALHLINGELVNRRLEHEQSALAQLLDQQASDETIVRHFYIAGLSRYPTESELQFWLAEAALAGDESDRQEHWQDFLWALLNSTEFRTLH